MQWYALTTPTCKVSISSGAHDAKRMIVRQISGQEKGTNKAQGGKGENRPITQQHSSLAGIFQAETKILHEIRNNIIRSHIALSLSFAALASEGHSGKARCRKERGKIDRERDKRSKQLRHPEPYSFTSSGQIQRLLHSSSNSSAEEIKSGTSTFRSTMEPLSNNFRHRSLHPISFLDF